jgi:hypothetical protein
MGMSNFLQQARPKGVIAFGVMATFAVFAGACSSDTVESTDGQELVHDSSGEVTLPRFEVDAFAAINPDPEIRAVDYSIDRAFGYVDYERDRIPRDAIVPVYSPAYVSPEEAGLQPGKMVIGLAINGDARAYPVGMMRVREMVNDEVGGTPVLVTW